MTDRIVSTIVEISSDKCANSFGVSPCTAGRQHTGTAQSGSASGVRLAVSASSTDDIYVDMIARITGGLGAGQERKITDYVGATRDVTVATPWDTEPDATSEVTVIDRRRACFNTFRTCQDKTNYTQGDARVIKLTEVGAPIPAGQLVRPYITNIDHAPTEISPEDGLAKRANMSLTVRDDTCPDVDADPYVLDRDAEAGGTYWARFKARVHNYQGRPVTVRQSYFDGTDFNDEVTESYVVDQIIGPAQGMVRIVLKDPLLLTTKAQFPAPSSGKLAVALTVNDLSLTLDDSSDYPASGYVRVKDEVIQYTANAGNVLSWPNSTYRAKFDTSAATAKIGDTVQLCHVFEDASVPEVLETLLNAAGLTDAQIDIAGMESEDETWLGQKFHVTRCIAEPNDISFLIASLCEETSGVAWWSPTVQKARYRVIVPRPPIETGGTVYTDDNTFIRGSVDIETQDNLRITRSAVDYELETPTSNKNEAKNYLRTDLAIDLDAESGDEYGAVRQESRKSFWFNADNADAMRALVSRRVAQYRDAPDRISFMVDPKDAAIAEGDLIPIETRDLIDSYGAVRRVTVLILRRDNRGDCVAYQARTTKFGRRYGFIAPAGHPDYTDATEDERLYAFICNSSGFMSDGSDGYLII